MPLDLEPVEATALDLEAVEAPALALEPVTQPATPPPSPNNALVSGLQSMQVELGSFLPAFEPFVKIPNPLEAGDKAGKVVKAALGETVRASAEAAASKIIGAAESIASPGGAVLLAAAPAAPLLAAGLGTVLTAPVVAEGAKEAYAGVKEGDIPKVVGGATLTAIGALPALTVKPALMREVKALKAAAPASAAAVEAAVSKVMPQEPPPPPPIELQPAERLPQPRPFEEAKKIFAQPFGMGKLPVLGIIADANARVRTPVSESVNTLYANRYGVGPSIAAALGEEIKGTIDAPFKIDPKTSKILNIKPRDEGASLHVGDVMEALQRDPDSYILNPEQRAAWERSETLRQEVIDLQKKEGVSGRLDNETNADPLQVELEPTDVDVYFPRIVTKRPKESPGPVGPRAGGVGAIPFYQKSRMFESEAEGVSKGYVYEPSIEKRLTTLVDRTYKTIFDKQFAEDPALGGRTRAEVRTELETALADKLASGEITPERIEMILDSKAAKGLVWEPGLMRYIFEPEVANELNSVLPKPTSPLGRAYATVNNAARELKLSGDFSAPLIQLLPTLYRNPVIWSRAVANGTKALFDPSAFDAYVKRNLEPMRELAQLGSSVGNIEQLISGQVTRGVVERIPGLRTIYAPFQRNFQTILDVAKIELWKAWRKVTPPEQRLEAARAIESQLGTSRVEAAGIKHTQAFTERALLLANSYYRGALNYIALLGQSGVQGKIARQGIGSLLAGGLATYIGVSLGLGMPWDKIRERLNPASGKFLMWPIKVGDRVTEVGIGSFYRSLLRLTGSLYRTAATHPEHFLSLDPGKNPFTRWWRGHASIPVGIAWNQFSGEDFLGRDTTIMDIIPSMGAPLATEAGREYLAGKLGGRPTDTTLSQVTTDTLASFIGASAYQESKRDQLMRTLDERAQASFKQPYGQLPIGQQRAVAEEVQKLPAFREKPEPTKREREMAFQADIDRVIRIRQALPEHVVDQLDEAGVKLRGFDPTVTLGQVKVPLTREQAEFYEEAIKAAYAQLIPAVLPAIKNASRPEIRQRILDKTLDKAREIAKAKMLTRNAVKTQP